MDSANITALDAFSPKPLTYRHKGETYTLPHPREMSVDDILIAAHTQALVEFPLDMPAWQVRLLFNQWCTRHDVPNEQSIRRLMYLLDRYRREIEFDLRNHLGLDLGEVFRERKWETLLSYIDHLPSNAWYTEAVSKDEEHAEMLAKAMAEREDGSAEEYHPPMRTWSQEASLLAQVVDAVNHLTHVTVKANGGGKGSKGPVPVPRPVTAIESARKRAKYETRKKKHDALAARLLPHKT